VDGEVLPADATYSLYFDVVYLNPAGDLFFEYADEWLKRDSATTDPSHVIKILVWAVRETDGLSVMRAEKSFRVKVGRHDVSMTELARLGR
jgi:hypothetical protein